MQFIKRSHCPAYLEKNKKKWTEPWVAHYRWEASISIEDKQPKKPCDGHWRDDDIRLLLIKDFHNNCGYCGESLPTPKHNDIQNNNEDERKFASKGDVDHLLPKAIEPELVYEWTNYIWSCKPCNQLKKEFFSRAHPLFNPCCEQDCLKIEFIEDTGQYALQNEVCNDKNWQQRFQNSEQKTLLNSDEICKKRKLRISTLRQRFISVNNNLENIKIIQAIQPDLAENLQKDINSNIDEIKQIIVGPDFFHLLKNKYDILLQEYPHIAELLV